MEGSKITSVLMLFLFYSGRVHSIKFTTNPTNGSFVSGSTIVQQCGVDTLGGSELSFDEFITTQSGNTFCLVNVNGLIVCDTNNYPRYSVVSANSTGLYNIIISNARKTDGGLFKCAIGFQTAPISIIVFDPPTLSLPQANVGQKMLISCTCNFGSKSYDTMKVLNQQPTIILRVGGTQLASSSDLSSSSPTTGNFITVNGTFTITSYDQLPMNADCEYRTSNPSFSYVASSPLNVVYPARNIRIDPIKETYTVNDTITCSANGYPVPDITWSYLVESDSGHQLPGSEKNESILEIDETWVGHKYDLVCTASNIVSGLVTTISANISFSVEHPDGPQVVSQAGLGWVAAVVIVPIVVIVAIIVIVLILRKKRQQAPPPKAQPQPTNNMYQNRNFAGTQEAIPRVNQNPNYANPPNQYDPSYPSALTPNGRHPMNKDSPGYGDLGVNHFGYPTAHPNLSGSFEDNNSFSGRAPNPPATRPPDLPGNRSPLILQQPQLGIRNEPDTMV